MPAPNGFFAPSGQFSIPRQYIRGIAFNLSGYNITEAVNVYTWTNPGPPFDQWTIIVDERIWFWTSNSYTLDYAIADFSLHIPLVGTFPDQPYTIQPFFHPVTQSQYLEMRFNGIDFNNWTYFQFPDAPGDFWYQQRPI